MRYLSLCLLAKLIGCSFLLAFGQKSENSYLLHECRINSANDNYLFQFHDRYFTNGLSIGYNTVLSGDLIRWQKVTLHFKIRQEIYTPSDIETKDVEVFDRPYAGYLYLQSAASLFSTNKNRVKLGIHVGIIGPVAGGGLVQTQWHKIIHSPQPQGWKYQINHEPVVNLQASYLRAWPIEKYMDLLAQTEVRAGTAFHQISQGLLMRFGKIHTIEYSAMTDSRLNHSISGHDDPKTHRQEIFVFCGVQSTWVLHNTLIEGSLFRNRTSPHTETIVPFLFTKEAGIMYSGLLTTFKLVLYALSREVKDGLTHNYLSIETAFRF